MKKLIFLSAFIWLSFSVQSQVIIGKDGQFKASLSFNGMKMNSISNDTTAGSKKDSAFITEFAAKRYADLLNENNKLIVNVKDFGAKGDGITDDAPAIEAAVLYAYTNKFSTLFFPKGNYISMAESLTMRSNIRYLGYGATIKQVTPNTTLFYADSADNVIFEGLSFQGLGTDYNGTMSYSPRRPTGIYLSYTIGHQSTNFKVINCIFTNFAYAGVYTHHVNNVWLENNNFKGVPQLIQNDNWCFGVNLADSTFKVTVTNNHIDNVAQGVFASSNTGEVQIINNKLTNIIGQHGLYISSARDMVVSGNTIKKCGNNGILFQMTSSNSFGMDNVTISNNIIDSAKNIGIYIYRISGAKRLMNFNVNNNTIVGDTTNIGSGIQLSNTNGASITGNTIKGYMYGLYLTADTNITVSNHKSYNSSEAGIMLIDSAGTNSIIFNDIELYEPAIRGNVGNAFGINIVQGSGVTLNNVYIRDTLNRSIYSLYIQPGADQATLRITNSTFLNTPVRFEPTKPIGEFALNIVASYFNNPTSILQSPIKFGNIGNTPSAQGATVSGSTITLQPASDGFGGIVSTGTQYFSGAKYFYNDVSMLSNMSIEGPVYFKNDLKGINKALTGYLPIMARNTTGAEIVWDMPNLGKATATEFKLSALNSAPTSSTDTGTSGEVRFTSTGIFWCIATNSWIRVTGTTF